MFLSTVRTLPAFGCLCVSLNRHETRGAKSINDSCIELSLGCIVRRNMGTYITDMVVKTLQALLDAAAPPEPYAAILVTCCCISLATTEVLESANRLNRQFRREKMG